MMKIILVIMYLVSIVLGEKQITQTNMIDLSDNNDTVSETEIVIEESEKDSQDGNDIQEIPKREVVQNNKVQNDIQISTDEPIVIEEQKEIETIESIENNQEIQQEESVYIVNELEENLPMGIPERTEEYRYNAEMTQKMIDVINNNPNENMIAYGYEVVVDSSAKEMSNPFTYTDERMLTKIQRRWGTIHVYAEDYYLNGNYFGTDCYIY